MKKNVASQTISAEMVSASTGAAFTGAASVFVTIDNGTQTAGAGTGPTHKGNGEHSYTPTQAETNGDHVKFTFTGTGAVPVGLNVYPTFPQTGDNYARLGAPAGSSIAADIATVDTVVDGIQADLSNATDGLGAIKADAAAILTDTGTTIPGLIAALNDPTVAAIAAAVWGEAFAGYTTNGTFGKVIKGIAEGWVAADGAVNDAAATTTSFVSDLSSAVDDFYKGQQIIFTNGALTGQTRLVSAYNGTTKAVTVETAWTGAPANTATFIILAHNSMLKSDVNAEADTAISDAGLATAAALSVVDGIVDAILVDTDTTIPALIAALNNISAAQVNAEVVDALATDTYAEPGQGAPAATAALAAKLNYLYKAWRNKTEQTATTLSLYDDAGTAVDQKATVSDDGTTATRGEVGTGP